MPYFSPKDVEAKKSCPKTFICPLLFVYENRAFLIGQNKSHDYAYKYHSTRNKIKLLGNNLPLFNIRHF